MYTYCKFMFKEMRSVFLKGFCHELGRLGWFLDRPPERGSRTPLETVQWVSPHQLVSVVNFVEVKGGRVKGEELLAKEGLTSG